MKPGTILAVVGGIAIATGGAIWVANLDGATADSETTDGSGKELPEGPHPKAVTPDSVFDFGSMTVIPKESARVHEFVVRNEGDAPLVLENGGTSCSFCTRNDFENTTLDPGEEAKVPCAYFPDEEQEEFRKRFFLNTNDPLRPRIEFTVEGRVDDQFHIEPRSWEQGLVERDAEITVKGKIYSRVMETMDPPTFTYDMEDENILSVEAVPLDQETLDEFEAISGYEIRAQVRSGKSGGFTRRITMFVPNSDGKSEYAIGVTGRVTGPVTVQPLDGVEYYPKSDGLDFGTFDGAVGKTFEVGILFKGVEEPIALEVTSPEGVNVSTRKDERYVLPKRERHLVTFEFPAGTPPQARLETGQFLDVTVKTSHPEVEEIKLRLKFVVR